MKNQFKNIITAVLAFTVAVSAAACTGADTSTVSSETASEAAAAVIKVGANITPHAEILEQAKPILAEKGITLEVVELEDSITPNTGVIEGSLDANYFQHVPYLEQFNSENGSDLVSIGAIHYEPFGIYAGKTDDLSKLEDGAVVAVPNNVTNEARALLLLAQEGIISLKEEAGIHSDVIGQVLDAVAEAISQEEDVEIYTSGATKGACSRAARVGTSRC